MEKKSVFESDFEVLRSGFGGSGSTSSKSGGTKVAATYGGCSGYSTDGCTHHDSRTCPYSVLTPASTKSKSTPGSKK